MGVVNSNHALMLDSRIDYVRQENYQRHLMKEDEERFFLLFLLLHRLRLRVIRRSIISKEETVDKSSSSSSSDDDDRNQTKVSFCQLNRLTLVYSSRNTSDEEIDKISI